ncbi:zygote arrest protein 1 [Ctenodactylus gundi]
MAALGEEVLGACLYPACGPGPLPLAAKGAAGPAPASASPAAAGPWSPFAGHAPPTAAEYLAACQRAQLLALLSPRPRGAGRRDAAVQVNPRRDAWVQCSLGGRPPRPGPRAPAPAPRRPRSAAVYSPVAARSAAALAGPRGPGDGDAAARGEGDEARPADGPTRPTPGSPQQPRAARTGPDDEGGGDRAPEGAPRGAEPGTGRPRFQFLEQKYGYYHCKDCNIRWESAYVWCVQGTDKVYFKQFCRTCQKSYNPYRVENITCQSCKRTRCSCPVRLRHVDPKRPHRQDLCGRCKGKRLSCDSTFSFKYII